MKPVSISQLNRYIKTLLQTDPVLGNVSVWGEVSNLKYHSSGHVYFALKDEQSRLSCFLPQSKARFLPFPLEEGMEIVASGYLSVYEKGGSYSLYVGDVSARGKGNLMIAFEALKTRLEKEGLFDPALKKPLPVFPRTVALVTSETGAAVRDMIRTIKNKNQIVDILLFPCLVQGEGAGEEIAENIRRINRDFPQTDVMIVGRGGGSQEELWAFNQEKVARAIFASECPVISAVGHETDFTIADFAADYRAATPTAAAEAAVPDIGALSRQVELLKKQLDTQIRGRLSLLEGRLSALSPRQSGRLLLGRLQQYQVMADQKASQLSFLARRRLDESSLLLEKLRSRIGEMDPRRWMEMGYAAVTDGEGFFVKSAKNVEREAEVHVTFADGVLDCQVRQIRLQPVLKDKSSGEKDPESGKEGIGYDAQGNAQL